jgi:hypothetical protein
MPGAEKVDAGVISTAYPGEGEAEAAEGLLDRVLVVGAYVGCRAWGEAGSVGVVEKA